MEESTDLPLLPIPLTPRPIVEEMVLGSTVGSPTGEPVTAPSPSMPGCQYRLTSNDKNNNCSDFSLAYSIHLHDPQDGSLLVEESTDLPLLPIPLTPRPIVEEMVLGSAVGSPTGEPVTAPLPSMLDLSQEGSLDMHQDASGSGPLHGCWTVCRAVNTA